MANDTHAIALGVSLYLICPITLPRSVVLYGHLSDIIRLIAYQRNPQLLFKYFAVRPSHPHRTDTRRPYLDSFLLLSITCACLHLCGADDLDCIVRPLFTPLSRLLSRTRISRLSVTVCRSIYPHASRETSIVRANLIFINCFKSAIERVGECCIEND